VAAPLPRRTKIVAIVLMILGGLVGIASANQVMILADPSVLADAPVRAYGGLDEHAVQKFNQVFVGTLTAMRDSRMFVLGMLAVASALAFVSAARLLRPAGISRESLRRMLAGSALATAILRTVDGAQNAVIYRNAFGSVADAFVKAAVPAGTPAPQDMASLIGPMAAGGVMVWTLVLVGVFLFTAQHFRSQKVKEFVARSDAEELQG
jgi:hypothetical protein